jgi:hypothetical protein
MVKQVLISLSKLRRLDEGCLLRRGKTFLWFIEHRHSQISQTRHRDATSKLLAQVQNRTAYAASSKTCSRSGCSNRTNRSGPQTTNNADGCCTCRADCASRSRSASAKQSTSRTACTAEKTT